MIANAAAYAVVRTIRKRALPDIIFAEASPARSSGMVSIMAATPQSALNLSVASPAAGVPVRAPSKPSCLKQQIERRQLDRLIGRAERNHDAPTSQATESGGDRLATRGRGQHHPRAAKRLERLSDIGDGAVDVVVRAQLLRELGPVVAAVDRDDLEPHAASVLHPEMA
jgi:hypothetical protein